MTIIIIFILVVLVVVIAMRDKSPQERVIELLNVACRDELDAYQQYTIAETIAGYPDVKREFAEHAQQEIDHYQKIAKRLSELGDVVHADGYSFRQRCGYKQPRLGVDVSTLIDEALVGELCAVDFYEHLIDVAAGDTVTVNLIEFILGEERKHVDDLRALLAS